MRSSLAAAFLSWRCLLRDVEVCHKVKARQSCLAVGMCVEWDDDGESEWECFATSQGEIKNIIIIDDDCLKLPCVAWCGMVWQSKFPVSRFIRSHTPTLARPLGLLWTSKETDGVTGTCWQLFWRQLSVCCRVGCSHISSRSMSKEIVSNSTSYVCTLSDVIELLKLLTAAFRANDNSWKCWQQKMMGLRAQPTMTTEAHQKFLLLRKSHFSHLTIFVWLPISSAIICLYTTIASYRHDVIQAHDV